MKRLVLFAVLPVACVAAAAAGLAGAAGQPQTTLDLTGVMTSFRLAVDAKPTGPSAGDLGYVSGKLFKAGKSVGRYTGVCAQFTAGNQQCTFVLGLPDGQIISTAGYGPDMNVGKTAHEAIVGGTGAYEGARGQADDREVSATKLELKLHLLR
jgi:hypothetical protein